VRRNKCATLLFRILLLNLMLVLVTGAASAAPSLEKSDVFPANSNGIKRHRIPGIVVTPKDTILAYCEARKNNSADWGEIEVHLRRSTDGGKTWLPVQHIAHKGARLEGNPTKKDGGETEQTVNNPVAIVDHTTGAIEFLYCVNYARCFSMRSRDEGATWSEPAFNPDLWEPRCMAGAIAHPAGVLLFSNPHTLPLDKEGKEIPGDRGKRENLTVKLSRDDGKTWPVMKTLDTGPSAYSDLAVIPDGTVLSLYERGEDIVAGRFNLEWLTGSE
jgi:hypothetical protein